MDHKESKLLQQRIRREVHQLQVGSCYHQGTLTFQSLCQLCEAVLTFNRQKRPWEHYIPSLQTFASELLVLILCDMEPDYIWLSSRNKKSYWHHVETTTLFWLHLDIFFRLPFPTSPPFFCTTRTQHTWASFLSLLTAVYSPGSCKLCE